MKHRPEAVSRTLDMHYDERSKKWVHLTYVEDVVKDRKRPNILKRYFYRGKRTKKVVAMQNSGQLAIEGPK